MSTKASTSGESSASRPKSKGPSTPIKAYLILYNVIQTLGWSYMLYQLVAFYTIDKQPESVQLWDYIGWTVIIFQNAAILEIFHAAFGIVPSSVILTTFQVFSRVMLVGGVVWATPTGQASPGLPLALLAWCITEIIRYGYYALSLVNAVPYLLVFLRYTLFIVLYPLGVTGELLCFYWAQSYVRETKLWSIELPNDWNFTFSYFYFLWIVMIGYIPIFPHLYLHMFAQRKKFIGGGDGDKGNKKKKQ